MRRFRLGIKNFFELYQPLSHTWAVYDNSREGEPRIVACGGQDQPEIVFDSPYWLRFSSGDLCK